MKGVFHRLVILSWKLLSVYVCGMNFEKNAAFGWKFGNYHIKTHNYHFEFELLANPENQIYK